MGAPPALAFVPPPAAAWAPLALLPALPGAPAGCPGKGNPFPFAFIIANRSTTLLHISLGKQNNEARSVVHSVGLLTTHKTLAVLSDRDTRP